MSDFKVGDRVRVLSDSELPYLKKGDVGTIEAITDWGDTPIRVQQDAPYTRGKGNWHTREKNLELLPVVAPNAVSHPAHYGGDAPYEVIKVAEAWDFDKDAYLFNVLKYIARHESKGSPLQDLKKAQWYLERKIARLEDALG